MNDRTKLPGKWVWFELVSSEAKKAQDFYGDVLGWKVAPFPMGDYNYEMILNGDSLDRMIGGYAEPKSSRERPRWIAYCSVEDVDAAAKAAAANGGKVLEAPYDAPDVGRIARIADPQGAEIGLFKGLAGDPPDAQVAHGAFFWNELHTRDTTGALSFYERVIGFSRRSMDMGPSGTYHILSRDGVDRGGVTHHLDEGVPSHWLPYVEVQDPDATIERARKRGATICIGPEDIPGVGRFGVLQDPTGAALAVMKPNPMSGAERAG
jgi:predicted enzyme related to lactoylglutathione lyase